MTQKYDILLKTGVVKYDILPFLLHANCDILLNHHTDIDYHQMARTERIKGILGIALSLAGVSSPCQRRHIFEVPSSYCR